MVGHASDPAHARTHAPTCTPTHTHDHPLTQICTPTHTHDHPLTQICTPTHRHAPPHTHKHTHTHAHIHTRTRTHTRTHTHTQSHTSHILFTVSGNMQMYCNMHTCIPCHTVEYCVVLCSSRFLIHFRITVLIIHKIAHSDKFVPFVRPGQQHYRHPKGVLLRYSGYISACTNEHGKMQMYILYNSVQVLRDTHQPVQMNTQVSFCTSMEADTSACTNEHTTVILYKYAGTHISLYK